LVVVIGLTELVVGGLTADSGVEFYLMAWATTTGGLWFLFERAERALGKESRESVVGRIRDSVWRTSIASVPAQFALLFDKVFGEKHRSRNCFNRSCLASFFAVLLVFAFKLSFGAWGGDPLSRRLGGFLLLLGVLFGSLLALSLAKPRSSWLRATIYFVVFAWLLLPGVLDQLLDRAVLDWPILARDTSGRSLLESAGMVGTVFALSAFLNFLPDYGSLLETRWAI
jgi:hypothetical protein